AMLGLAISELVALPVAQSAARALMARNRARLAAVLSCVIPAARLIAVAGIVASGADVDPEVIAASHLIGSLMGAGAVIGAMQGSGNGAAWQERPPSR